VLALIASGWFFDEVVRHVQPATPAPYQPVTVTMKETMTVGWACLPDCPCPPGQPCPRDEERIVAAAEPGQQIIGIG
jgi:hypothetical protein